MNYSAVRRLRLSAPLTVLFALAACLLPSAAAAAENYTLAATSGCAAGSWGSGSSDEAGIVYSACNGKVVRYAADGTRLADVTMPNDSTDVAPSPDGAYLYSLTGGTLFRMNRQANGTYVKDATWAVANFGFAGQMWAIKGRGIAVDSWGDLYVSSGAWYAGEPNVVVKYTPGGKVLTVFGGWGVGVGQFNVNMGLAVTRDGRSVYVSEQTNGRVQRFDHQPGGAYAYATTFGSTDVNCLANGTMSAPYDVGVDPWGFVYVMDTSCARVQKWTGNGDFLGVVASNGTKLAHGLAIGRSGEIYVGQWGMLFNRAADNPAPGPAPVPQPLPLPDTTAPILTGVTVPAVTTAQTIDVVIAATDENSGVAGFRIANEDGTWTAWQNFAPTVQHTLVQRYGIRGITVQVRDAALNESNTIFKTIRFDEPKPPAPPADTVAPVLTAVAVPATTTIQAIDITITATDNVGIAKMRFANQDGIWGPWHVYYNPAAWNVTAGFGVKGVTTQVMDAAGNTSNTIYKTLRYQAENVPPPANDLADPILTTATMPTVTTARDVTITLDATDDTAVTKMRFANEDGNWGAWEPYATTKQWTLTANYGPKLVFVQVGDNYWHYSTIKQLRTRYQTDLVLPPPPVADNIAPMLNGATVPNPTTTQLIDVAIDATDNVGVAQVRFANEDGNWGAWQAFAPTKQWTLTPGYLNKLVFVQVRDASGNESNIVQKRTQLVLVAPPVGAPKDAAAPVITAVTVPNPALTRTIDVGITATDDIGVTHVRFANEDGTWSAWQAFAPTKQWTLTAGNLYKLVFVQVRDAAGRESNVMTARTLLQAPAGA